MTLSVIIPAYNEANSILAIIRRILEIRPALTAAGVGELELIVVDDGSTDCTAEIADREGVRVIRHKVNRGYGAALKTGFAAAKGEFLGFLDADGTYPPEHFPELSKEAVAGIDLVVGSRRSGAKSEMPLVRRAGNLFWSYLVSCLCRRSVQDPASGMRVFRREALEKLYPLPDGLHFTPVMSTRAVYESVKFLEIPIPYTERVGRSKLRAVSDGMRFLTSILATVLSYDARRVLGPLALALIAMSILIAVTSIWMGMTGETREPIGAVGLLAALFFFVIGVMVFGLSAVLNHALSMSRQTGLRSLCCRVAWIGRGCSLLGIAICASTLVQSVPSGLTNKPWLFLLVGTMLAILGAALMVFGGITRVAGIWARRGAMRQADLNSR